MTSLDKDDALYFLHLRKTGGTTIITVLDNNFHKDSIFNLRYWMQLLDNMPIDFARYRLFGGHFGYRFHQLLPKKPLFMTILREPIDHCVSNFNHRKQERVCELEREFYIGKTIDDIIMHPTEYRKYLNPQVCDIANDKLNELHETQLLELTGSDDIYEGRTEEEILRIAKERLKDFVFIGLTERYQESLLLLAYTFKWTPVRDVIARNVTANPPLKREQIGEFTLKKIEELTVLDKELYEYGKQIFEDRYNDMIKKLKAEYYRPSFDKLSDIDAAYEMLKLRYSDIYEKKHPVMLDTISFDFSDVLNGWGWQVREENPQNKKIFRWTGPETRSIIDLPLKRDHDLEISIELLGYMTEEILESFRLKVNMDKNVVQLTKRPDVRNLVFVGLIPKTFLQSEYSFTRFIFEVSKTVTPMSLNSNSADARHLGIAVSDIKVSPTL